ncbi:MAG: phage head closure protein [Parvularculaceae bacterium]
MIGQLRHRVDIRARVLTPDGVGGAAPSWTTVETAWAGLTHLTSARNADGARDNRLKRVAATLRHRNTVELGQRLRFADDDYDIVSIETTDGRERFMILICEEIAS